MSTPQTTLARDVRQEILDTAQIIISGKGYAAVGLNEILAAAGVPKGSFYHYFESKDAFGEALLESYFETYLEDLDAMLQRPGLSEGERLMVYWQKWVDTQASCDPEGKCLAVKLGAEVSDLSETMRKVLLRGTSAVIGRLARTIERGLADGSVTIAGEPQETAETLYQTWLGASLLAKIARNAEPLLSALAASQRTLGINQAT
ncbi:TetR/AcrR family transcriptional regulator [Sphingomonadaceae bacterium G21617-S1]|mgnify:CR=1 FL=1|jgi:TetR/AcrR family transcriptional repressor of nem operon|uniref:TetR/AcrR family transcriptional regulator n=1 Tax=Sphingobium yanoikuyae TaxID=13690 RepID=A0A9X7UCE5_SPHYA|nr:MULTISPECIES: TetR/AcrR family transcriptional regulator [Alphaproteobacteria]MBY0141674.1 TetR/AcrR family transcriptional regulator [Methylorubrum populi]MCH4021933.1 TetR/AcrR family transcriptional regulator [Acetobacter sp.]MCZ4344244.1 TetR/AcrR family transcriptional regulator [Sphingomonadaceae bacterium G21617-S1]MBK3404035.1 TetR/AcrR family transcriptional regulator [Methylorubrum rhodesianum]MCH4025372.1 TetR/AcrR family transcriptional regulator [Acetobacter fabarum]